MLGLERTEAQSFTKREIIALLTLLRDRADLLGDRIPEICLNPNSKDSNEEFYQKDWDVDWTSPHKEMAYLISLFNLRLKKDHPNRALYKHLLHTALGFNRRADQWEHVDRVREDEDTKLFRRMCQMEAK